MIKAIETHYNGYRFRSRLEARWAVFFDALGIRYEYEPEGYATAHGWYLPDFFLPDIESVIEIKPEYSSESMDKVYCVAASKAWIGAVFCGPPGNEHIHVACFDIKDSSAGEYGWGDNYEDFYWYQDDDGNFGYWFDYIGNSSDMDDPTWNRSIYRDENFLIDMSPQGWKKRGLCEYSTLMPVIQAAQVAARSARFEHGETPST